jgi:AcrR family transcriptional regulator
LTEPNTRTRLLEATIAAIDAGGEAAVNVEDIARSAHVTAPTIYNHFRNRDALIAAAQAERFDRQLNDDFADMGTIIAAVETREQLLELADLMLAAFIDPARAGFRLDRVSALGAAIGRPELAAVMSQKFVQICIRFAGYIQPLQEKGLLRADLDLAAFSAWFVGMVTGRLFIEVQPTPIDSAAWDAIARRAVLAAVLPD